MSTDFELVSRPHGECWKHKTQAFWIVFYQSLKDSGKPAFLTYRAVEPCKGREPWTVNNKNVGNFITLEEAMSSVE